MAYDTGRNVQTVAGVWGGLVSGGGAALSNLLDRHSEDERDSRVVAGR